MNSQQPWNKESGTSLVAILVAVALFGIVAVMASQSFRNISTSGRRVEAAMSAREVENVMVQSVVDRFKAYVRDGCLAQPNAYFNTTNIGIATLDHKVVNFYDADGNIKATPELAEEDVKRCRQTAFSTVQTPNSDTFYGCFGLVTDNNAKTRASKGAFASNRGAFVELFVKLRNFKTDTLVKCSAMIPDSGFGLEVYYSLHWTTPAGAGEMYDTKLGSLNAAY